MGDAVKVRNTALVLMFVLSMLVSITPTAVSMDRGTSWTYHNSSEIAMMLDDLASDHPDQCVYTTAQDHLGTRGIPGGMVIPILFVGDMDDLSRPYVMLIGAHHGNEPDSAETVLAFAVDLLEGYDAGIDLNRRIVDDINLAILPVVNPAGLDNGTRTDENGEDPNRDYPFDPAESGYQSDGIPLTTAGASAVHSLARMYPFSAALSYHSGSKGIFTPWGADLPASDTPDSASYIDMGRYLSRASGYDLVHGPANDFSGLGYLHGAFDDHLYGSMFLGEYLYNDTLRLPRSTSTCTIELINVKGENPGTLGDPSSVWDPLGDDDGTVPMGMRMSYAACEMANPSIEMDVDRTGAYNSITVDCRGFTDPLDVALTVVYPNGSSSTIPRTGYEPYSILPGMEIRYDLDLSSYTGSYEIRAEAHANDHWLVNDPDSYPAVEPQSVLSRTGDVLHQNVIMEIIRDDPPAYEYPFQILGISEDVLIAGEDGTVDLRVDLPEGETFQGIEIDLASWPHVSTVRYRIGEPGELDDGSTISLPADQLLGLNSLPFLVPELEGSGILEATLRTDRSEYNDTWPVTIIPSIKIAYFSYHSDPGDERIDLSIASGGVRYSTPVVCGLSRNPDQQRITEGWLWGPMIYYLDGNGSTDITIDVPNVEGAIYLHVSGPERSQAHVRVIDSDWELYASALAVRILNGSARFGPAVVFQSGQDGLVEVNDGDGLSYKAYIEDAEGEILTECTLEWVRISGIDEVNITSIRAKAFEAGFDPEELTGAWMCNIDAPEGSGRYRYYGQLQIGAHTSYAGCGFVGLDLGNDTPVISGEFVILEEDDSDGSDDPGFNWIILVVFGAMILLVVAVTIIRYPAHWKEPEPEEDEPPRRRPERRPRRDSPPQDRRGLDSLKGSNRMR